jgi:hypothetical protein
MAVGSVGNFFGLSCPFLGLIYPNLSISLMESPDRNSKFGLNPNFIQTNFAKTFRFCPDTKAKILQNHIRVPHL